eukprot:Nitzschia sp. Nitz4//scaffold21_size171442//27959//29958//NITZ4_002146-RA/size171442-augustus-gene-0.178-mRNA-1//1//CDS//3329542366//36//frame0
MRIGLRVEILPFSTGGTFGCQVTDRPRIKMELPTRAFEIGDQRSPKQILKSTSPPQQAQNSQRSPNREKVTCHQIPKTKSFVFFAFFGITVPRRSFVTGLWESYQPARTNIHVSHTIPFASYVADYVANLPVTISTPRIIMTSTLNILHPNQPDPSMHVEEEETEDEEVKLNCIGGFRGVHDSDFSTDDSEPEEEAVDAEKKSDGPVAFSGGSSMPSPLGPKVIRPRPERLPRLAEAMEPDSNDSQDNSTNTPRMALSSESECPVPISNVKAPGTPSFNKQVDRLSNKFESLGTRSFESPKVDTGKTKRVLSSNTLAVLDFEARGKDDSPKRIRTCFDYTPPGVDGGVVITDEDDEELDITLQEELENASRSGGDSSPVPLLTPPQSPRTVPEAEETLEWPSNLVVDNAMMTASATRPLSPNSLQKLEESEENRLIDAYPGSASVVGPLLHSIYVGMD